MRQCSCCIMAMKTLLVVFVFVAAGQTEELNNFFKLTSSGATVDSATNLKNDVPVQETTIRADKLQKLVIVETRVTELVLSETVGSELMNPLDNIKLYLTESEQNNNRIRPITVRKAEQDQPETLTKSAKDGLPETSTADTQNLPEIILENKPVQPETAERSKFNRSEECIELKSNQTEISNETDQNQTVTSAVITQNQLWKFIGTEANKREDSVTTELNSSKALDQAQPNPTSMGNQRNHSLDSNKNLFEDQDKSNSTASNNITHEQTLSGDSIKAGDVGSQSEFAKKSKDDIKKIDRDCQSKISDRPTSQTGIQTGGTDLGSMGKFRDIIFGQGPRPDPSKVKLTRRPFTTTTKRPIRTIAYARPIAKQMVGVYHWYKKR